MRWVLGFLVEMIKYVLLRFSHVLNFARNPVAMFTLMVLIAMQHRFYSIDATTHILLIAKQPIATTKQEF